MTGWFRWDGGDLVLSLRVQPRASRDEFVLAAGRLRARITAPPVDGAANSHLLRFIAAEFGVAGSHARLVRGTANRAKVVRVMAPKRFPPALALAIARDPQS